jgi:hypothetical protein
MRWIDSLKDVLDVLDQYVPWLLPSMESFEKVFPVQDRLLICGLLVLWLAVLRYRAGTDLRLEPGT